MYITTTHSKGRSKDYASTLLRESYREDGKVKNRTIANLSHCKPNEIEAIKLALAHKGDPTGLVSLKDQAQLEQGKSFGADWAAIGVARQQGIEKALGTDRQGQLAIWQVVARVLEQGSRLSAVRLATTQTGLP